MMSLSLVIHNHQPVDNNPEIIDKIYRKSYLPFLETISRYPKIKITLHYTGYLLSWIEKKYPEFISKLRHMIAPILTAVSSHVSSATFALNCR